MMRGTNAVHWNGWLTMTGELSKVFAFTFALMLAGESGMAAEGGQGILLLAHGSHRPAGHEHSGHGHHTADGTGAPAPANVWNRNVQELAERLDTQRPTEVAFGMADAQAIQVAVDRLQARGVKEIVAVPLFVSSYSPIIGNFRYILGLQDHLAKTTSLKHLDRITSNAHFRFSGAMDAHPLIGGILLERAVALATDPATTTVIVIAHGPNTEEENRLWLKDMEAHAALLRERGGFCRVSVLTHRNDAPLEVKAAARAAFRQQVADASRDSTVVVVPLLLSAGGIEKQVEADLDGLPYRFAEPLMPHPNIERWVETRYEELMARGGGQE
ncbi:hypothetical protein GAY28_13915 [Azospirillum brasilense]|nr:hypothetical protein [Azospirillum brasilense]